MSLACTLRLSANDLSHPLTIPLSRLSVSLERTRLASVVGTRVVSTQLLKFQTMAMGSGDSINQCNGHAKMN